MKVPRVAFYTNTESALTATRIYEYIYKKYDDQYGNLWFRWEGKPLIIAESEGLSKEIREFFTIKKPIWPTDANYNRNGWPWMEFGRLYTKNAVYGKAGERIVNVSAAQHCDTIMFSETAFYGGNDHTRSWHDGANDTSPDAPLYGYNFAEQWEWALEVDPETVFVTAFNEWTAGCLKFRDDYGPIQMCDCCDMNCSRDIEPMQGGFGDNYFMQLAEYIRRFKGCEPRVNVGPDTTVDIDGSFRQFDAATAVYTDPVGDTEDRNHAGYGTVYTDDSGRNDIAEIRVMKDADNYYVYIRTADALTAPSASGWMTLFIDSGASGGFGGAWDVAVNRTAPKNGTTAVEKWQDGAWQTVGEAQIRYEGNELMLSIPRAPIDPADAEGLCDIRFKAADNYDPDDVMSFYTKGDCAPYGRFSFIFSDAPVA